ncbi:MAG TPA: sulfatase-like hydrolase/transferase [Phycisphaerae bacterium]|nr:sulfatase-like hydrolase/transferase [Phycisphaerae bacterium]HRY70025.1 sulfatase-like hydrolase/transferase [Phycisphaerae bacterium]HSA27233.1 sulfatase-like hydrolase/transferase [Phycisphaerae bacterium]
MSHLPGPFASLCGVALGVVFLFGHNLLAAEPPAAKPNIILILADDLGHECIGANGSTSYKTPVLDRLAAGGMRFEHCYVQPLCTPTRVQLMTGIYNVRNYINFGNIDPAVATFAHLLKRAGYATCITGKWQMGQDVELPRKLGFDEYCLWQHTRRPPRYANPGLEINGVEKNYTNGEYGPDLINAYARDFVIRHKDRPFFLYYPMMLTHAPYQPTPDSRDWDPKARDETVNRKPEHFADMVSYMDKLIGKLVATLEEQGLRDKTLVLFLGDSGTGKRTSSLMGQRVVMGGKGSTTAAGMHVPLIASWPGRIPPSRVCVDLVDSTDFLPTICEAAGVLVQTELRIDGRSLLPQLRGQTGQPRQWIYSWYSQDGATAGAHECAFSQQYKLYRTGELYDLAKDPDEKRPLPESEWNADAAAAANSLQAVLHQYQNARPEHLKTPARKNMKRRAAAP